MKEIIILALLFFTATQFERYMTEREIIHSIESGEKFNFIYFKDKN